MRDDLSGIWSTAEAEAILEDAVAAFGFPIEGYALAATSSSTQRLLNCEAPLAAPMFAESRIADGAALAVDPTLLGVGVELQFSFCRAFPSREDDLLSIEAIGEAILACHVGLQILGRRLGSGVPMNSYTALSDFGLAAYHLRGPAISDWSHRDLADVTFELLVDGHVLATGKGRDTLGHPLAALSWLARAQRRRGLFIEADSWVAIGSCTGLSQLTAGHTYIGRVANGPAVTFRTT